MRAYQSLLLAGAALWVSPVAFGFAEIARGELVLSTTARATYDSRVFGGFSTEDDYIFTLDPRLIYRRGAGQMKMEALLGGRLNRYFDHDELDSEDLVASVQLNLPESADPRSSGSFLLSYDEHTDVNYDVNLRIREKTFFTRFNGDVPIGLKTAVLLSGSFRRDQRNQFSDLDSADGSIGFRYDDFLGGTRLDLRYRRMDVDTTGGNLFGVPLDQSSDTYSATLSRPIYADVRGSIMYGYRELNRSRAEVSGGSYDEGGSIVAVGIQGPFLPQTMFPKVETSLSLGYQEAEVPGVNDFGGSRFFGNLNVSWQARERTRLTLEARRALELSINDLTVETTLFRVGVNQEIGNFMDGSITAGLEKRDYRTVGREDDARVVTARLHYRITRTWSAGAEYRLRDTDSSNPVADFARHVALGYINYLF